MRSTTGWRSCGFASREMAKTPISELVATIELVRTVKKTLESLADVVEELGARVERLEQKAADTGSPGR